MMKNGTYLFFKKSIVWLSVFLFFIASCQTKKSIESLLDITLSKNIAASKTTSSFHCSVYEAKERVSSRIQKTATSASIPSNDALSSDYGAPETVFRISETYYPLKIPLYLLFKNIKIAL